jgi:hypothetical protein
MAREVTDQIHSIAAELAILSSPAEVSRMLHDHSADSTGHCRGCRYATTAPPVWPCRLWAIADQTRRSLEFRSPA